MGDTYRRLHNERYANMGLLPSGEADRGKCARELKRTAKTTPDKNKIISKQCQFIAGSIRIGQVFQRYMPACANLVADSRTRGYISK